MENKPCVITACDAKKVFTKRPLDCHKGDFGHVLVIGGDHGMAGAARLVGEAALRTGAGLVSALTHPEHVPVITGPCPEIMTHGFNSIKTLKKLLDKATVIVLGPGLGQSEWSEKLFTYISQKLPDKPMVLDADGLNFLAKKPFQHSNWILTPHLGEAARLLNKSINKIKEDKLEAITLLQKKYQGVIILKGPGSLILGRDGNKSICEQGNPGMASGGMGDVLSGVIAGLLAQGHSLETAAKIGVWAHANAADLAAKDGERSLLARDVIHHLRDIVS